MRFAVDIPNIGTFDSQGNDFADPHFVAELAHEAEQAGWDGFFIWDHIGADWPVALADPWVLLAAAALRTTSIKLGPMVTPLPRRRPWKLARETITLDHLSQGRLILGVGIGGGTEYTCFNESGDDRIHGAMLDEGLSVLQGLWSGEPFSYTGAHYQITNAHFLPKPVQAHIPIWVAGIWPNKKPFRRAATWDGVFPLERGLTFTQQMAPQRIQEASAYVQAYRPVSTGTASYDLVHWGITTGEDPAADRALVQSYQAVGVTWWLENLNNERGSIAAQRARIRKGPPRLD
jgi:alkanesulfonate monooxygenase SsuD/methylene tetrahydromethanopterin reductase-like flavin-dependent oxidoreductase (luciferase family)